MNLSSNFYYFIYLYLKCVILSTKLFNKKNYIIIILAKLKIEECSILALFTLFHMHTYNY